MDQHAVPGTASPSIRRRPGHGRGRPALALALALLLLAAVAPGATPAVALDPAVPPQSTTSNPPACAVADLVARFHAPADWSRTMLDWTWRLPKAYEPTDLVPISWAGLRGYGTVRHFVIRDLRELAAAARAAGAPLAVESGYRSYAVQGYTFAKWVRLLGWDTALFGAARAGHSEHQLGTTVDFKTAGGGDPWAIGGYRWSATTQARWLAANAWRYGFVLSFPYGKKAQVCYGYEPWHYRYVGRSVARSIHASGLTLRVWLWRHGNSPTPVPAPTPAPTPTPTPAPTPAP